MNERIKELAEQADDHANKIIQMPGEYHPDWHDIRDQNFAKLIINEILMLLADCYRNGNNTHEWDNALRFLERDIREHFEIDD